jgi:pimeloyl-ACP methyl ester carboxylesterase
MKRWLRRIALLAAALISLAAAVGTAYETYERARTWSEFPPMGRLVDIGGRKLQLDCRGTGSPVVVFESGRDLDGSLAWFSVQDEIAKLTRACAYSRAGILWSDPTPGPHTGPAEALDLHALLDKGGEHPPFVLVGHSAGGINALLYTKVFGSEVAGLVLVDASHPEQFVRMKERLGMDPPRPGAMEKALKSLSWMGLTRLIIGKADPTAPRPVKIIDAYTPMSFGAAIEEMEADAETFASADDAKSLGSRPLFVLTAGLPPAGVPERFGVIWRQLQDEEASWSSVSEHQVVPDSHHDIQLERPERVIAAIRWTVDRVRGQDIHAAPD